MTLHCSKVRLFHPLRFAQVLAKSLQSLTRSGGASHRDKKGVSATAVTQDSVSALVGLRPTN